MSTSWASTGPTSTGSRASRSTDLHWGGWTPGGGQMALIHDVGWTRRRLPDHDLPHRQLDLVDAAGSGAVKTIATADGMTFVQFRPPDGRELLYRAHRRRQVGPVRDGSRTARTSGTIVPPTAPSTMDLTFADDDVLGRRQPDLLQPDHRDASFGDPGCCQLFVVNADGSDLHKFVPTRPVEPGTATRSCRPTGSGSPSGATCRTWRSIACPSSASDGTGQVIETGPEVSGGAHWIWSPDSTKILMFPNDVDTGKAYLLDPSGGPWTDAPMDVGRFPRLAAHRARVK